MKQNNMLLIVYYNIIFNNDRNGNFFISIIRCFNAVVYFPINIRLVNIISEKIHQANIQL